MPSTTIGDPHICASCSYLLVYLSIISVSFDTWYRIVILADHTQGLASWIIAIVL